MASSPCKQKLSVQSVQSPFSAIWDAHVADLDHCQMTDLCLIVSDSNNQSHYPVQVHQSILLPVCPLLGSLVQQAESVTDMTPIIILADVSLPTLRCILNLVYTGKCIVKCDDSDLQMLMLSLGFSENLDIATDTEALNQDSSGPADNPSSDIPQLEPDCDTSYTSYPVKQLDKSPAAAKEDIKVNIVDQLLEQQLLKLQSFSKEATKFNASPVKVTCLEKPTTTKSNWSCHFCQKMFRTAEQLTFHGQRQHNTLGPFHCSFCKFSTKNYGLLKKHLNIHTRANQVDCDVCGKAFLCKSDMNRHRSVHSDERNVKCVHCDECFKSDYFLRSHIKRVHCKDMENYKCKVKSATDCKDHEAAKHECPRYFCNQCEYKASRLDSLKIHHLTKHEGARYRCFQCEYEATKPSHLKRHQQDKHEGLRYSCDQCEYEAARHDSLKIHQLSKHEGIKYSCNECDHQATRSCNLKRHKESKHEGFIYPCNLCEYKATAQRYLKRHQQSKHSL